MILVELHFQTPQCITSNPIVHFPVHVQWLWPSRVFPGDKCNKVGGAVRHGVLLQCQVNTQLLSLELHLVRQLLLSVISAALSCNMNLHCNHLLKYNFWGDKTSWEKVLMSRDKVDAPVQKACIHFLHVLKYVLALNLSVHGPATSSSLLCLLTFSSTFPCHLRRR